MTTAMHRLPSQYSVTRFQLAALLLLVKCLLFPASAVILCLSLCVGSRNLTAFAIVLLVLILPVALLQWLIANRARCPLCIGHPLAHKSCAVHRDTRRLFGSYRLLVALTVIFLGRFHCPYCGESTLIAIRQPRRE
jgi:hypothetical protein